MTGLEVRLTADLSGAACGRVSEFVESAPCANYLQTPDWVSTLETRPRHSYALAEILDGAHLIGTAVIRRTRLIAGYHLAAIRWGPITHSVEDLDRIMPPLKATLIGSGACSVILHPRWLDEQAEQAQKVLAGHGATFLPHYTSSPHRQTAMVDLTGFRSGFAGRVHPRLPA